VVAHHDYEARINKTCDKYSQCSLSNGHIVTSNISDESSVILTLVMCQCTIHAFHFHSDLHTMLFQIFIFACIARGVDCTLILINYKGETYLLEDGKGMEARGKVWESVGQVLILLAGGQSGTASGVSILFLMPFPLLPFPDHPHLVSFFSIASIASYIHILYIIISVTSEPFK